MKFSSKFFRNRSFSQQTQQPPDYAKPFESFEKNCMRTQRSPVRKEIAAFFIEWLYRMHSSVIFDGFDYFFRDSFFLHAFRPWPPPRNFGKVELNLGRLEKNFALRILQRWSGLHSQSSSELTFEKVYMAAHFFVDWQHCKTLLHAATHCNSLQHTAKHCKTLQNTSTHCNTL